MPASRQGEPPHTDEEGGTPAIAVHDVRKIFGSETSGVVALDGIDLAVAEGEFVVLLGPSGCGKTTLLRILGGLEPPTDGRIEMLGRSLHDLAGAQRRAMMSQGGFVFQEDNLLPWRSSIRNVELPLEIAGKSREERRAAARELLQLVGLPGFEHSHPHELSGGMRQRVAIARAFARDPRVLLMDEPFGALDAQTRDQMNLELQRIWLDRRKTVVFVTHSIQEAVFLADRIVLLRPRPGLIQSVTEITFPRPRGLDLIRREEFVDVVAALRAQIGESTAVDPGADQARGGGGAEWAARAAEEP